MRIKAVSLIILSVVVVAVPALASEGPDSVRTREGEVKAAFTYNFMKFVEWPPGKMGDVNDPMVIGLIGSKDLIKALEPITRKNINKKNIILKYFAGYEKLRKPQETDEEQWNQKIKVLKDCHVLLFCSCSSVRIESSGEMIKALKDSPVLTIGETRGFLESGGMVNFVTEDNKVNFEINNGAAKQVGLTIRSKLLRLAKRVIEEQGSEEGKG